MLAADMCIAEIIHGNEVYLTKLLFVLESSKISKNLYVVVLVILH